MLHKPNKKVVYITVLIIIIFSLGIARLFTISKSFAISQVEILFQENLISFYFEDQVRDIAKNYVQETRYAGRININRPPQRDNLNLYIFYYSENLPEYLKYNCTSFPKDEIILCDHDLLDSILETIPVVYEENDSVQHPFLMNWVIGHEIGHIVLEHGRSQYLNFQLTNQTFEYNKSNSVVSWANDFYAGNKFEREADQYAIRKLNIGPSARSTWLQYGNNLADAIFWETNKKDTKIVHFNPEAHPPMILRTLYLFYQLREEYVDFKGYPDFFEEISQDMELREGPINLDDMFFGGYYLGSDYTPEYKQLLLTDLALSLWVNGNTDYASYVAKANCTGSNLPNTNSVYDFLFYAFCRRFSDEYSATAINDNSISNVYKCDELEPDFAGSCVGLLFLHGVSCHTDKLGEFPHEPDFCLSLEEYKNLHDSYNNKVRFHSRSELIEWMIPIEYIFRSEVVIENSEDLDLFVHNAIFTVIETGNDHLGRELLISHIEHLKEQNDPSRLITYQQMLWNLHTLLGDHVAAQNVNQEIRQILDNRSTSTDDQIRYHYIAAINEGLLISLNTTGCEELPLAVLTLAEQEVTSFDIDENLQANTMENIAFLHLCSNIGDPLTALKFAEDAFQITNKLDSISDEDILTRLWILTFAYLKAGEYEKSQSKAKEFIKLYSEKMGDDFDTSQQIMVSGELTSLDLIFQLNNPVNLTEEIINSIAVQVLREDDAFVQQQIDQALKLSDSGIELSAETWNSLCWWSSLYGRATDVVDNACEQAVALAPENLLAGHRDSRGLARAITNDIDGAIEDFQFFVDRWSGNESSKRNEWLNRLKAGESPSVIFDSETIDDLRKE